MSHAVIIKNAVKKYGDFTAVNGISLNIEQGEFFTLLGPSGCGKTTLLRMIAGFNTVDGGEICFDEQVINNLPAHKRDIGMVFQNYAIFPHLNVADNVAYGLKARKVPKEQITPGWMRHCGWCRSTSSRPASPTSCPADSSSGWPWPGPSSSSRGCC